MCGYSNPYSHHITHPVHLCDVFFHVAFILVLLSQAAKEHKSREVVLLDVPNRVCEGCV